MSEIPKAKNPAGKYLIVALKLTLTLAALALVIHNIDSEEMLQYLKNVPPLYLLLSFLTLTLTQVISAHRMQYYFVTAGYHLKASVCVALYFIGALFNIILPGGISGDGYKAYLLKKRKKIPALSALRLILCERANGLFLLFLLAFIFAFFGNVHSKYQYANPLLFAGILILIPAYFISARIILKDPFPIALRACRFSIFSQSGVALSAFFIFNGMGVGAEFINDYLALFMLSNVISIIPISIGGAGLREVTFFYGTPLLGLDTELGVACTLAFFAVHVATSLIGLAFLHRV